MDKIVIQGGLSLKGKVPISGSKNAALPILAATILCSETVQLSRLPNLSDIRTMLKLLEGFGFKCSTWRGKAKITSPQKLKSYEAPYELVKTMRASILVLGPLLARFGKAKVSLPGGCAIGARPVNLHLKALEQMGAKITVEHGYIFAEAKELKGATINFEQVTVTGTENILMAATLAKGKTRLTNCAIEPEVDDLAHILVKMGAKISGIGTRTLEIEGISQLHSCQHEIMPDRIEAGTFMIAAVMTKGNLLIENFDPILVDSLIAALRKAGATIEINPNGIRIKGPKEIAPVNIFTDPYPGFPTDFQAQFMALMCIAQGKSEITESIFENRFMHVGELIRMGAQIKLDGNIAKIQGAKHLSGAPIMATDLRASACLVLAGLAAEGITEISRVYHIDRGYEKIEKKFRKLGAKVKRIKVKY